MDAGRVARGMMACSGSHVSGCPMQHSAPLGRFQPVLKAPTAVRKVCITCHWPMQGGSPRYECPSRASRCNMQLPKAFYPR